MMNLTRNIKSLFLCLATVLSESMQAASMKVGRRMRHIDNILVYQHLVDD